MTRDWDDFLSQVIATFGDKDGNIRSEIDGDDEAVGAVLIALHRAVTGKIDLQDLAIACVDFDESSTAARN